MVTREEVERVVRALVGQAFPVLTGALCPVKGRVVKTYDQGREADVKVLDASGKDDPAWPVLARLPLPPGRTAKPGNLVRLGFYYADKSQPYIDEVL